jgi:hypothetical protein
MEEVHYNPAATHLTSPIVGNTHIMVSALLYSLLKYNVFVSTAFCAHNLAPEYYAQSVRNKTLWATCLFSGKQVLFGEYCPHK